MSAVRIATNRDKSPISVAIRSLLIAKASRSVSREYDVTAMLRPSSHPGHIGALDGGSYWEPVTTKFLPANFSPELLTITKSALDTAVHQIDRSNRTPATKAKMAQRIVKTASEGITDLHVLMSAAVDEGRVRAA